MSQDQQDPWFDVLSGKKEAGDEAGMEAAQALRKAVLLSKQAKLTPLSQDDARYKRIMNTLEAKGAFKAPAPTRSEPKQASWIDRLRELIWPQSGRAGSPGRYAWVALAVLAFVVVPVALQHNHSIDGDDDLKSAPASAIQNGHVATAQANVIETRDVNTEVARLEAALNVHGVQANREQVGQDLILTAKVAADKRDEVAKDLADWGVVLPSEGDLKITVRLKQP